MLSALSLRTPLAPAVPPPDLPGIMKAVSGRVLRPRCPCAGPYPPSKSGDCVPPVGCKCDKARARRLATRDAMYLRLVLRLSFSRSYLPRALGMLSPI